MRCSIPLAMFSVAFCVCLGVLTGAAHAGTIIKLDLADDSAQDIFFDSLTLDTIDDGVPATTGDQQTSVEFLDILDSEPDISVPPGSFTLAGLSPAGAPDILGGMVVVQEFAGGTLDIYGPAPGNVLLLSGTLDESVLFGSLGPPAAGAVFTTTFGMFTGGTLASKLDPDTLSLSMSLTDINGGAGLSVTNGDEPLLRPFNADVTLNIAGVPEPASALLALLAAVIVASATRCDRR